MAALGHNHPRLVEALRRQAERNCHSALAGMTHEPAAELAEALCRVAPAGLEHVFYSDDGSTAVEVALKLALQYWHQSGRPERTRFVALDGAFHGETLGVTAHRRRRGLPPPVRRRARRAAPHPVARRRLGAGGRRPSPTRSSDTAARSRRVVLEPIVQGAAGMRISDPAFLRAARELCDRHDVLLVADEVFTGYGRTGPMWACEHAGVAPDLLCTAKGFTGGMLPMAATLASERVERGFRGADERAFYYGHSFCGNPLGAAVALEVLRVYEDERVLERARPKADAHRARLRASSAALPGVAGTRALGMIGALDLAGGAGYLERAGWRVYDEALRRGAYLRPLGNVVYVAPPLNIPDDVLDELLAAVRDSVAAVLRA